MLGINQTRVLWVFPLEPMPFLYCNVLLYFLKPKIVLLDFLLGALAKYFEIFSLDYFQVKNKINPFLHEQLTPLPPPPEMEKFVLVCAMLDRMSNCQVLWVVINNFFLRLLNIY